MNHFKLHKLLVAIACAVLVVVMLTSCSLFPSQDEPAMPTLKTPKPIKYAFFQVEKADLESKIEGTGTVTSIYYTTHSFPTSGGKLKGCGLANGGGLIATDPALIENASVRLEGGRHGLFLTHMIQSTVRLFADVLRAAVLAISGLPNFFWSRLV